MESHCKCNFVPEYAPNKPDKQLIEITSNQDLQTKLQQTPYVKFVAVLEKEHGPSQQIFNILKNYVSSAKFVSFFFVLHSLCCAVYKENAEEIIQDLQVKVIPSTIIFKPCGVDTIEGNEILQINKRIETFEKNLAAKFENEKKIHFDQITQLISENQVMIFMKGNPEQPKCKFSRKMIELLSKFQFKYQTFDILENEPIRQWLKFYSEWPTFPQIFINKQFIGGIDILTELIEKNEFEGMIPEETKI